MENKQQQQNLNVLLGSLFIGFLVVYIDKLAVSLAIVDISKTVPMTETAKGMIMSMFFIGYALAQIPMSLVINKLGSKKVILWSIIMIGVFQFIFSLSTTILAMMIIRLLSGMFAHAGYPTASTKEVTDNFPVERRTFAKGVLFSAGGFASVLGPIMISPIITKWGWQRSYLVTTAIAFLVALLLFFTLPKKNKVATVQKKSSVSLFDIWKIRNIWSLFLCAFFVNSLLYGVTSWIPTFLTEQRAYTLTKASVVVSGVGIFSLLGALGGSYVVGKFFQHKDKLVISVLSFIAAILVFVSYYVENMGLYIVILGLSVLFFTTALVTLMSIPMKVFSGDFFAPGYSTIALGGIIGGAATQIIIGGLLESFGTYTAVYIYLFILGLALAAVILLFDPKKYQVKQ